MAPLLLLYEVSILLASRIEHKRTLVELTVAADA